MTCFGFTCLKHIASLGNACRLKLAFLLQLFVLIVAHSLHSDPVEAQITNPAVGQLVWQAVSAGTIHNNPSIACQAEFTRINGLLFPKGQWQWFGMEPSGTDTFRCLMKAPNPFPTPVDQRWLFASGTARQRCIYSITNGISTSESNGCNGRLSPRPEPPANSCRFTGNSLTNMSPARAAASPVSMSVGNPIDIGSGRKSFSVTDYASADNSLLIERIYSYHKELNLVDSDFGFGWQGIIPARGLLTFSSTRPLKLTLRLIGGLEIEFTYSAASGQWTFSSPYPDHLRATVTALFQVPASSTWATYFNANIASWRIDLADGQQIFVSSVPPPGGGPIRVIPTRHVE